MTPRKSSRTDPQILEMPPQKMAVVQAKGAPHNVFPEEYLTRPEAKVPKTIIRYPIKKK